MCHVAKTYQSQEHEHHTAKIVRAHEIWITTSWELKLFLTFLGDNNVDVVQWTSHSIHNLLCLETAGWTWWYFNHFWRLGINTLPLFGFASCYVTHLCSAVKGWLRLYALCLVHPHFFINASLCLESAAKQGHKKSSFYMQPISPASYPL